MTYKKYVAKYEYHRPSLVEVEVVKETEKTISVSGNKKELIGTFYYLPDRISKDSYHILNTQEDAVNWLITKAYNDIAGLQIDIDKVNANIQILSKMKEEKA